MKSTGVPSVSVIEIAVIRTLSQAPQRARDLVGVVTSDMVVVLRSPGTSVRYWRTPV